MALESRVATSSFHTLAAQLLLLVVVVLLLLLVLVRLVLLLMMLTRLIGAPTWQGELESADTAADGGAVAA